MVQKSLAAVLAFATGASVIVVATATPANAYQTDAATPAPQTRAQIKRTQERSIPANLAVPVPRKVKAVASIATAATATDPSQYSLSATWSLPRASANPATGFSATAWRRVNGSAAKVNGVKDRFVKAGTCAAPTPTSTSCSFPTIDQSVPGMGGPYVVSVRSIANAGASVSVLSPKKVALPAAPNKPVAAIPLPITPSTISLVTAKLSTAEAAAARAVLKTSAYVVVAAPPRSAPASTSGGRATGFTGQAYAIRNGQPVLVEASREGHITNVGLKDLPAKVQGNLAKYPTLTAALQKKNSYLAWTTFATGLKNPFVSGQEYQFLVNLNNEYGQGAPYTTIANVYGKKFTWPASVDAARTVSPPTSVVASSFVTAAATRNAPAQYGLAVSWTPPTKGAAPDSYVATAWKRNVSGRLDQKRGPKFTKVKAMTCTATGASATGCTFPTIDESTPGSGGPYKVKVRSVIATGSSVPAAARKRVPIPAANNAPFGAIPIPLTTDVVDWVVSGMGPAERTAAKLYINTSAWIVLAFPPLILPGGNSGQSRPTSLTGTAYDITDGNKQVATSNSPKIKSIGWANMPASVQAKLGNHPKLVKALMDSQHFIAYTWFTSGLIENPFTTGHKYKFTMQYQNAYGAGAPYTTLPVAYQQHGPNPPDVSASSGPNSIVVEFEPGNVGANGPTTKFVARATIDTKKRKNQPGSIGKCQVSAAPTAKKYYCTISGLTAGSTYIVIGAARNRNGTSPPAYSGTVTPKSS